MITIRNAEILNKKIECKYNPMVDFMLALDLLTLPEHQSIHTEWANDILKSLSRRDKLKLHEVKTVFERYLNMDASLDLLNPVKNWPLDELLPHIKNLNNWKRAAFDPKPIIPFLVYLWETYIKPVIESHKTVIEEHIIRAEKLLKDNKSSVLLTSINERIKFSRGSLKIEKWLELDIDSKEIKQFCIEPLVFVFPYLVMDWIPDNGKFILGWEVPFKGNDRAAKGIDNISKKAFALSDKSRLRMLLILKNKPMTQKELSRQMGFAKSTTSRHVNILIDAGIINCSDNERNVLLSVNRKLINNLSAEIDTWLAAN